MIRLGTPSNRRMVTPPVAVRPEPPTRCVQCDGEDFDVVWYPHRDALSLLPPSDIPEHADFEVERGHLTIDDRTPRWSFLP